MSDAGHTQPVVAVAGITFDADERVLLIQRNKAPARGVWTVPGGRVELGEQLIAACRREFKEETGLDVDIVELIEVVERFGKRDNGRPQYHFVIFDYLVTVRGGELSPGSDAADAVFTKLEECDLPLTEGLRPVIEKARTRWRELRTAQGDTAQGE